MTFEIKGFDLLFQNANVPTVPPYSDVPRTGFPAQLPYPSNVINFFHRQAFAGSDAARLLLTIDNTNVTAGVFNIPESQENILNVARDPIYYYVIADDATGSDVTSVQLSTGLDDASTPSLPFFPLGLKTRIHNQRSVALPVTTSDASPVPILTLAPGETVGIRRIAVSGTIQFVIESRSGTFSEYQIINSIYRVGDLWMQNSPTSTPPGQGIPITGTNDVITWTEVTNAQGAILIGAGVAGSWAGAVGSVGGNADATIGQSTDPMTLANLIPHRHVAGAQGAAVSSGEEVTTPSGATSVYTGFTPPESQTPIGIPLSNLRRYLVGVWQRTV